jgi:membrane-associated phospholipid phosphatase
VSIDRAESTRARNRGATSGPIDPVGSGVVSMPWRRALAWLSLLGPFFFLSYGLANWLAGQRAHVPSVVFDWEARIPFWDWTILPYWSIDLLYGLSLFLCTTRSELDTHARRLLTAQLAAVACFILFPLRFSLAHPATDGFFGAMFTALAGFDKPFNQLPSLHIALAAILWALYARRLSGGAAHRDGIVAPAGVRLGADDLAASLHRHPRGPAARRPLHVGVAVRR